MNTHIVPKNARAGEFFTFKWVPKTNNMIINPSELATREFDSQGQAR